MKKAVINGVMAILAALATSSCRTTTAPMASNSTMGRSLSAEAVKICQDFNQSPKDNRLSQAQQLQRLFELDQKKLVFTIKTAFGQKHAVSENTVSSLLGKPEYRLQNDHGYWVVYYIGNDKQTRQMLVFDFKDQVLTDIQQTAFTLPND